jgi:hypothetical protein
MDWKAMPRMPSNLPTERCNRAHHNQTSQPSELRATCRIHSCLCPALTIVCEPESRRDVDLREHLLLNGQAAESDSVDGEESGHRARDVFDREVAAVLDVGGGLGAIILRVETAVEAAADTRNPEVAAASVEDNIEILSRSTNGHGTIILRILVVVHDHGCGSHRCHLIEGARQVLVTSTGRSHSMLALHAGTGTRYELLHVCFPRECAPSSFAQTCMGVIFWSGTLVMACAGSATMASTARATRKMRMLRN